MEFPQSLQVIAEIGIALAGFSGLFIALRRRAGPLSEVQKFRLQILLLLAFGAMFLALMPELLLQMGVASDKLWRVACLMLVIYQAMFLYLWVTGSRQIKDSAPEIFNWLSFSRMLSVHLVVLILLLAVVVGLVSHTAPGAYLAGLVWFLVHAAQQFTRMLFVRSKGEIEGGE